VPFVRDLGRVERTALGIAEGQNEVVEAFFRAPPLEGELSKLTATAT
jgi:hypothetical protein